MLEIRQTLLDEEKIVKREPEHTEKDTREWGLLEE